MAYTPFSNINIDTYFSTNGIQSALYYLNKSLARLEIPTVGGIPLKSVADMNITHDKQGNIVFTVKQIGQLFVRYNESIDVVERSLDGETWSPLIPVIGDGNMTKSVYDTNDDGIVDRAESLDDGINVATAADVRAHLDTPVIALANPVQIGDGFLKNFNNVLLYSPDGLAYGRIFYEDDNLIMLKTNYDSDGSGIVDKAEELFNGTDVIAVADIQQLQADYSDLEARVTALEGV